MGLLSARARARKRLSPRVRRLVLKATFWRWSPARVVLRLALARDLADVRRGMDAPFYLRQANSPTARRWAARDPALHYLMDGARRGLSPDPRFDAVLHARAMAAEGASGPPFLHYRRGSALPANDLPPADERLGPRGRALLISHARGGGSARWLRTHAEGLRTAGFSVLFGQRHGGTQPLVSFELGQTLAVFDLMAEERAFCDFAKSVGVTRLVINHMVDWPDEGLQWPERVSEALGIEYEVLLHDYHLACPRIDLVTPKGLWCGLRPALACHGCTPVAAVLERRARGHALLAGAARVIAPSQDLAMRFAALWPDLKVAVEAPELETWAAERVPAIGATEPLRLVILGALNVSKGRTVVQRLAETARRTGAPLRLVALGEVQDAPGLAAAGVEVHGRYLESQVDARLAAAAPHAVLLPAIWPETWSFTLSAALRRPLPILAFDIGAMAERLRAAGRGLVLPYSLHDDPERLLATLLSLRERWISPPAPSCR